MHLLELGKKLFALIQSPRALKYYTQNLLLINLLGPKHSRIEQVT